MKVKIIASLAVVGSLLLSGCVTRYVPVQSAVTPPPAREPLQIVGVNVCKFAATMKGQTLDLPDVTLVTFSDGDQWVKFPNGARYHVIGREDPNDSSKIMAYYVKSYSKAGDLVLGGAHHCK
ncbi:hypothetical protein JNO12_22840 [Erwinia aphidicola]|nr:hypothetical protein [Erwinia aphidicola]